MNTSSPRETVLPRILNVRRSSASAALSWLARLATLALVLGILLRFYHLDRKAYGNDEATTSLRVAGYTLADYNRDALDGRIRSVFDLRMYQLVTGRKTAGDTVRSLAAEDPQHAPLFYLLERAWVQTFGNSIAARRSLSALIGSVVPLAAGWLSLELFGSLIVSLAVILLVSVSPFHVLYSQIAREYELWALATLLSSAFLLRAIRRQGRLDWGCYASSVVLGLYTDVLFMFVLFGHAVYVATLRLFGARRPTGSFTFSAACALLAFVPWLGAMFAGRHLLTNNPYLEAPLSLKLFALKWAFNLGALFFDLDYKVIAFGLVLVPIFAIVGFAIVEFYRRAPRVAFFFVAILTVLMPLSFIVADLVHGQSRSTAARYLVPAWLGLEIAVAFVLSRQAAFGTSAPHRAGAAVALIFLFICGLASDLVSSQSETWWADGTPSIPPIARIIDAAHSPLVIFKEDPLQWDFSPIELTNVVRGDVRFQLYPGKSRVSIQPNARTTFVLDPSPALRAEMTRTNAGALKPVYLEADSRVSEIATMRAEAAAARSAAGIRESGSSLWELSSR